MYIFFFPYLISQVTSHDSNVLLLFFENSPKKKKKKKFLQKRNVPNWITNFQPNNFPDLEVKYLTKFIFCSKISEIFCFYPLRHVWCLFFETPRLVFTRSCRIIVSWTKILLFSREGGGVWDNTLETNKIEPLWKHFCKQILILL